MSGFVIPPAALEATRTAWLESASDYKLLDESIRAAALALLEAWPVKGEDIACGFDDKVRWRAIILPLAQEGGE